MIYFPPVLSPDKVAELAQSEGLELWRSLEGKPIGWKRRSAAQPAEGQVMIAHGNAGCAFQCGHYADVIQRAAPFDVFILEYPGYADRPGKPSQSTLEAAADEAFTSMATNAPIYLAGESLGTGVAAYLAGRHPDRVTGIALLGAYTSLTDVGQARMKILPVKLLLRDRFPAAEYLQNYQGPVAVLIGGQDTVVPGKFGRRLYDGYAGPKRLW